MSLYQVLRCPGVANLASFIALSILALQDIKYGEIHYRYLILIVDFSYPTAYFIIIFTMFFYKYMEKYIGGADILIIALLISRYGYYLSYQLVFFASLSALIYCLYCKVKEVRFIPFILFGFMIAKGGIL